MDGEIETTVPDLEVLRDELVVPIAREVFADIAKSMPSETEEANADYTELLTGILTRSLNADLNLTTDNPYLFQLVLGVYGAFSTTVQKCSMPKVDEERFSRIAGQMMRMVAGASVPMGKDVTPADQETALEAIQPELEALFARENLTSVEITYILQNIFRSLKTTQELFSGNIDRAVNRMEAKILGLNDLTELTMSKLDETLKADMAALQEEK